MTYITIFKLMEYGGYVMQNRFTQRLGFGFMRLPTINGSINHEEVNRMVDYFIEHGGNYFDTGYFYHNGQSEETIRKSVIERYPREEVKIADKMPVYNMTHSADEIFRTQLKRCGVNYFDYYLVHNLSGKLYDGICREYGVFEKLQKYRDEGKIGKLGISFHDTPEVLERIISEHSELDFIQLQVNYLDWNSPSIQSGKCYKVAREYGLPVKVMEPVKGGNLVHLPRDAEKIFREYSDDTNASWALRFALDHDGIDTVLSGMSCLEHVKDNIKTVREFRKLDNNQKEMIEQVKKILLGTNSIPCTYCDYCTVRCPQEIPIPKYFSVYNNKMQCSADQLLHSIYYDNYARKYTRASACIACYECEKVCPQKIGIVDNLGKVAEILEK